MKIIDMLREKSNNLPASPGVYIMKDAGGKVIYVGKSRKLKNRVNSYFTGRHHSPKTEKMVSLVRDFDFYLCTTEIEALTLENVLIKKYSPKYNIKLKDAKSYPYIKVSGGEYPRITVTRERRSDGGKYFGPYQSSESARLASEAVMKIFALPTCKRVFPRDIGKERPCIYRQIGRCCAPCTGEVSREEYAEKIKGAERLFRGDIKRTKELLLGQMTAAADAEEFERAARIRDSISALDRLSQKQQVVGGPEEDRDVFSIYTDDICGVFSVLNIRAGMLLNKYESVFSPFELTEDSDKVSLISSYYDGGADIPREVLLSFEMEDEEISLLSDFLAEKSGKRTVVRTPERGEGLKLCHLAHENAKERARHYRLETEREETKLVRLTQLLGLEVVPERIEAYDISNIGREFITASMVVYESGKFKKSDYRIFRIKTTDGVDDYGSMREAISRRISHIGDGSLSLGREPDLILVDGGAGQVNAAKASIPTGIAIPVFGMVKDDFHKTRALTDGEGEISIASDKGIYVMIYEIQEEAHRFAVSSAMGGKRKSLTRSSLENIKGIGPSKAKLLLSHFGSLSAVKGASAEALSEVKGITSKDADAIVNYFYEKGKK